MSDLSINKFLVGWSVARENHGMMKKEIEKNILVIDDDVIFCEFLKRSLSAHGFQTYCLSEGEKMPKLLEHTRIDMVILDLVLPGLSGMYWLTWLRQCHSYIPVIMTSVKTDKDDRLCGLENGAKDYVAKPFHPKELLIRMENVLGASPSACSGKKLHIGELEVDAENCHVSKNGATIGLTQLETTILKLLYLNGGAPVSRDALMKQMRGIQHNPLDRSIDIHINKLRKKIENNPAAPFYIRTVRGKGYYLNFS